MGKPKPIQVSAIDFVKTAQVNPDFKDVQGMAYYEQDKIYINKTQPEKTIFGQKVLLNHEICHIKLHHLSIKMPIQKEELYCDLEALVQTADRYLRVNEKLLKKHLLGGLTWRKSANRYDIVSKICKFLDIHLTSEEKTKLATYKPRPLNVKGQLNA